MSQTVLESIRQVPEVDGPIPVTATSHPFCSMAHAKQPLDLAAAGYTEEEYFISGTANVYEGQSELAVKYREQPYTTRIMVRKPAAEKFSGRVYIDIYNASNGYDIEDVWRRSYEYYMAGGHVYVGVTAKPINVVSLKKFDPERYASLRWDGQKPAPLPKKVNPLKSIKGMEEGLVWDILSQLGYMVKGNRASFLADYDVTELYLTGQSQSGVYLNTYAYFFHRYVRDIYDGFLTVVGAGRMRDLRQNERLITLAGIRDQLIADSEVPFILVSAHGDINLFRSKLEILRELGADRSKIRHYEMASAPHTDPTSPLIPDNREVEKTGNRPRLLDGDYDFEVNSIKLAYYVNAALEHLHEWAVNGVEPPASLLIERDDDGDPLSDEHGNGVGGLRSPYVDVPIATYRPNEETKLSKIGFELGVNGSMEYFDGPTLAKLYASKDDYLTRFAAAVDQQVADGWLLPADAQRMVDWSRQVADELDFPA
ncbi:alpha/beta hydrolase domain-containing protein [Trueperella bialowiezensis]|uniref:Alpha/beta hydrolase domain-containing protein n=1 Tax=Trueperella bialowiezensis TaxID=312285 RepID=A0A448PCX5_9ACTO|nr:alpha/beta hydrolase domain-containing protein [Trueperella bialowiezensis]VEI12776.1 Uncharacterised protein [Trueperella bialowiezensis]